MSEALAISSSSYKLECGDDVNFLAIRNGLIIQVAAKSVFCRREQCVNANDANLPGFYVVNNLKGNIYNYPLGTAWGTLLVFEDDGNYGLEFSQLFIPITATPKLYLRKKGSSSGWSAWQEFTGVAVNAIPAPSGGVKRFASAVYVLTAQAEEGGWHERGSSYLQRRAESGLDGCGCRQRLHCRRERDNNSRNISRRYGYPEQTYRRLRDYIPLSGRRCNLRISENRRIQAINRNDIHPREIEMDRVMECLAQRLRNKNHLTLTGKEVAA